MIAARALMGALLLAAWPGHVAIAAAAPAWLVFDGHRVCSVAPAPAPQPTCFAGLGALRGPPVPQGDGQHWWIVRRDGDAARIDLLAPELPAAPRQVPRLGRIDALAASRDGQWLLLASGDRLRLFDAAGVTAARWPLADREGRRAEVLKLLDLPSRRSFLVLLGGVAESWEISYDPAAPPIFEGMVHDYRMGEGLARPGYLAPRRTRLPSALGSADADGQHPWFWARPADAGAAALQLVQLDVRRVIATWPLAPPAPAQPPVRVQREGRTEWAVAANRSLQFIEPGRWTATAGWTLADDVQGLRADADGTQLWILLRAADGAPVLGAHPGATPEAAATWRDAGLRVTAWSPSPDGTQLLLAWRRADDPARGGLLWLDGRTLAPLQRSDGGPWDGVATAAAR